MTAIGGVMLVATLLAGCSVPPTEATPAPLPSAEAATASPSADQPPVEVRLPPVTGVFDYQLGGAYDVPGLAVVARDATDAPLAGAYNLCYVNGFQTQPGEGADWLNNRSAAVLRDAAGDPVTDPDWPDEYVLDPSTAAQRAVIIDALGPVVAACATNGFDAVEIDNLDTFTRFIDPGSGRIERAGAFELARSYVRLAHDHGLAIGQKNAAEAAALGHDDLGFDFAVAEECAAYDECAAYTGVYGPQVLQIEYTDNLSRPFAEVCAGSDRAPLTILRDRELLPEGSHGHVREQCAVPR